jgi:hypothetical protein
MYLYKSNYPLYVDSRGEYTMAGTGIMAEIRDLLAQGQASGEVIALGYKPSTVFKVQRQFRKEPAVGRGQSPVRLSASVTDMEQSEAELTSLQQRIVMSEAQLVDVDSLRFQLDQADIRIKELEAEAHNVNALIN